MALIERTVFKTVKSKFGICEVGLDKCKCDKCGELFEQKIKETISRRLRKIAKGLDICKGCSKVLSIEALVNAGTKYLTSRSKEDIYKHSLIGGIASGKSGKFNSSKFSTENWNNKSYEEQQIQVKRANAGLHEKLKDPVLSAQHYAKVLSQSKLGYMSKAHKDLHSLIEHLGFNSHHQISNMQVDECNEDLKIVIEYNGDFWHCNPKTWKADQYNSTIRMTAGEKWQKDIARKNYLAKLGYNVIVIWESGWIENPQKYLDRIERVYNEISEKIKNQ